MIRAAAENSGLAKRTISLLVMFALAFGYFPSTEITSAQADQFSTNPGPPTLTTPSISKASAGAFQSFDPLYPRSSETYTVATTVSKPGGIDQLSEGVSMCLWVEASTDCDSSDPNPQTTFIVDWNWSFDTNRDVVSVRGNNQYSADATRSDYDADAASNDDTSALVEFIFQVSHAMRNSFTWNLLITADDGAKTATVSRERLTTSYFALVETNRSSVSYNVTEDNFDEQNGIGLGMYAANAYSDITMEATGFSRIVNGSRVTLPISRGNVPSNLLNLSCSPTSTFDATSDKNLDDTAQIFTQVGLMTGEGPDAIGDHSCRLNYRSNIANSNMSYSNVVTVGIQAGDYNAPSSISTSGVTANSVTVSWGEPTIVGTGGVTLESYIVEISDDGGSTWNFATETTSRTYTAGNLSERSSYDFRVKATTSVGAASQSTTASTDSTAGASLQTLQALNSSLRDYSDSTSASTIISAIEAENLLVFATPEIGSLAESMASQTDAITQKGVFSKAKFDANTDLPKTGGFNNNLDDKPFIGFVGFANGDYLGAGLMAFTSDANGSISGETYLKDLYRSPNTTKEFYTYILNANGTAVDGSSEKSGTKFSDNSRAGSNGYYRSTRFSADDGIWGFAQGKNVNGDSPGPHLDQHRSVSYGIQNYHAGDSSYPYYYWGERVSSSNAVFYFFHGDPPS